MSYSIRYSFMPSAAIAAIAFATGCGDSIVDPPPEPLSEYQILFLSGVLGTKSTNIYRMNADGSGRENLSQKAADSYGSMSVAPDGLKITFYSDRDDCVAVYRMNVDGTDIRQLTPYQDRCNRMPRWSPDGTRIAFGTTREGPVSVYVMNADGSNPQNVSAPLDGGGSTNWPSGWTPDGRVVFHRFTNGALQAHIVNHDGTGLVQFGQAGDHAPNWSPDGSKVAFLRPVDGRPSLFVMDSDGSNLRQLTNHAGDDWLRGVPQVFENYYSPWSPDGTRIAFMNINGVQSIDVIRVDGTDHRRLNVGGMLEGWSPDGRITFSSGPTGTGDIFLFNADGSGLVNLTNSTSHDSYALWVRRP